MPAERTVVAMNDDCCRNETLDTFCGSDAVASTVWLRIGYRFRRCLVRVHTDRISEGVLMFILRGNHMQLACKLTVASVSSLSISNVTLCFTDTVVGRHYLVFM